jgi:hypothetical protein
MPVALEENLVFWVYILGYIYKKLGF